MLGTKQRHKLHTRSVSQNIDRAPPRRIDARLIGDQSHPLAPQQRKVFRFEHIDTRLHPRARSVR